MRITTDPVWHRVVSAGEPGKGVRVPVRCLILSDPGGLYVTDNGIVTHNSPSQESMRGNRTQSEVMDARYMEAVESGDMETARAGEEIAAGSAFSLSPMSDADGAARADDSPPGGSTEAEDDYRHRPRPDGPRIFDLTENEMFPEDVYSHPEYYGDMRDTATRESVAVLRKVRGKPDAMVTIYRAAPKGAKFRNEDWVAVSKTYAKNHAELVDAETIISMKVPVSHVRSAGDDLNEFGYFPPSESTRDDAGNIVPPESNDIRYSLSGVAGEAARRGAKEGRAVLKGVKDVFVDDLSRGFQARNLITRELVHGRAGPRVFNEVMDQMGWRVNAVKQIGVNLQRDVTALMDRRVERDGVHIDLVRREVRLAMEDPASLEYVKLIDPELGEAVRKARNYVDHLTSVSADILKGQGHTELADVMLKNVGTYLKRGYAMFDGQANWDWVSLSEAAAKGEKMSNGEDARTLIDNAKAQRLDELTPRLLRMRRIAAKAAQAWAANPTAENRRRRERHRARLADLEAEATNDGVEAYLANLTTRGSWMGADGSSTATDKALADTTSFARRKNIPEPYRKLMGEETDALSRYLASVDFLTQHVTRYDAQRLMREIGIANRVFSTTRSGIHHVELEGSDKRLAGFAGPVNALGKAAPLYTTESMDAVLKATFLNAPPQGEVIAKWANNLLSALRPLEREGKANYVAASVIAPASNIIGGLFGVIQTGAAFNKWDVWKKAFDVNRSKRTVADAVDKAMLAEMRELRADLIRDGVIDTNVDIRAMARQATSAVADYLESEGVRRLSERAARSNRMTGAARGAVVGAITGGRMASIPGMAAGAVAGAVTGGAVGNERFVAARNRMAETLIAGPDNYFKILNYLEEYKTLVKAGMEKGMDQTQAETYARDNAAEIARNGMPSYDQLAAWARNLASVGLLPTFLAFKYLLIKNYYFNARQAGRELTSGSKAIRARGLKRAAGLTAVTGSALGAGKWAATVALSLLGYGKGEEDDEKVRLWRQAVGDDRMKYADLAFAELSKDKMTWIELDYLVPQAALMNYIRAVKEGADNEGVIDALAHEAAQQWAGNSIVINPIAEGISNRMTGRDRKVTQFREDSWKGRAERVAHGTQFFVPSAVRTAGDATRAGLEWAPSWDTRTPGDIVASVAGLRVRSRDGARMIEGAWAAIASEGRAADAPASEAARNPNVPGAEIKRDASAEELAKLRRRADALEDLMLRMNYSISEIDKMKSEKGVSDATFETKAQTEARMAAEKARRNMERIIKKVTR